MNKKIFLLFINFLLINTSIFSQKFRSVENTAFKSGEKLYYKIYYKTLLLGNLKAGSGTLSVEEGNKLFYNRSTYHIKVQGKSEGVFNFFIKIDDRFETYVDREGLFSWNFIRKIKEGKYRKYENIKFNAHKNLAFSKKKIIPIPDNIQDIISVIYYARTLNISDKEVGDTFPLNFFIDDSVYLSVIKYAGKEIIKTDFGKIRCLKLKPMVVTGKVFKEKYPMTLWISDDKNHLPILMKTGIKVGSVAMELINYSGLKNKKDALIVE